MSSALHLFIFFFGFAFCMFAFACVMDMFMVILIFDSHTRKLLTTEFITKKINEFVCNIKH